MKNRKRVFFSFMILLSFLLGNAVVYAEEEKKSDDPVGFTVETILPENQFDKEQTYFHLAVEPEQKQKLEVKITSTREEPTEIRIFLTDAITNNEGGIDYAQEEPELDESLKIPLTEVASISDEYQTVTVENFEEKIVEIELNVPKEPFAGIKLGAIRFIVNPTDDAEGTVVSKYGYTIGLLLSEDKTDLMTGANLDLMNVSAKVVDGQKAIVAKLQNPEAKILSDLAVEMIVTKKGDKDFKRVENKNNLRMAPNSNFDYSLKWGMEAFEEGTYIIEISANSGDQKWHWKEELIVDRSTAKSVNDGASYKLVLPGWVSYIAITIIILSVSVISYLTYDYLENKKVKKKKKRNKTKVSKGGVRA